MMQHQGCQWRGGGGTVDIDATADIRAGDVSLNPLADLIGGGGRHGQGGDHGLLARSVEPIHVMLNLT